MNHYTERVIDWRKRRDLIDSLPPDSERTFTAVDADYAREHTRSLGTGLAPGPTIDEQRRETYGQMLAVVLATIGFVIGLGIIVWAVLDIIRTYQ